MPLAAFRQLFWVKDEGATELTSNPLKSKAPFEVLASKKPGDAFAVAPELGC